MELMELKNEENRYELCESIINDILESLKCNYVPEGADPELEIRPRFEAISCIDSRINIEQKYDDVDGGFSIGCYLEFDGEEIGYFVFDNNQISIESVYNLKTPSASIPLTTTISLKDFLIQMIRINENKITSKEQLDLFEKVLLELEKTLFENI